MRVAVVGGGPGGLTTLKHLLEAHQRFPVDPIEVRLFESQDQIGGTFRYRTYDDCVMVSSKHLSTFGDFRIPDGQPGYDDFLTIPQYLKYLEDYAEHFKLAPYINLNTNVINIRRQKVGKGHIVTYESQDGTRTEWPCDALAICAGLHVNEAIPEIPGIENVPEAFHSSKFKSADQFGTDKNVIILGAGETAMDLGMVGVHSPVKSVTICHRNGFVIVPKRTPYVNSGGVDLSGPPLPAIDTVWSALFDGAYAHPRLRNSRWQWEFYDKWNKFAWLAFDLSVSGYGQHCGKVKNLHLKEIIFVKNQRVSVFFNPIYDQPSLLKRLKRRVVDMIRDNKTGKHIDVAPWPTHVDEDGVMHFEKNDSIESKYTKPTKADIIVYATGYKHLGFQFFDPSSSYPETKDANIRSIWKDGDEDIAFIGFVRPQIGAIPPLTEFQAQLWIMKILGQLPSKLEEENWYRLRPKVGARILHGVDHESYCYQLALDMGIAPSFWSMMKRGWRVFATWAVGSNYNTIFRMEGPWRYEKAEEVVKTELFDVIPRRDMMWGFVMLNALPILVFGMLSLFYFILDIFVTPINAARNLLGLNGKIMPQNGYFPPKEEKSGTLAASDEKHGGTSIEVSECW